MKASKIVACETLSRTSTISRARACDHSGFLSRDVLAQEMLSGQETYVISKSSPLRGIEVDQHEPLVAELFACIEYRESALIS